MLVGEDAQQENPEGCTEQHDHRDADAHGGIHATQYEDGRRPVRDGVDHEVHCEERCADGDGLLHHALAEQGKPICFLSGFLLGSFEQRSIIDFGQFDALLQKAAFC